MRPEVPHYIRAALRSHKDQSVKVNGNPEEISKIIQYNVLPEPTTVRNPHIIKRTRNEVIEEAIEYIDYLEHKVTELTSCNIEAEILMDILKSVLSPDEYSRFIERVENINKSYNRLLKEIMK